MKKADTDNSKNHVHGALEQTSFVGGHFTAWSNNERKFDPLKKLRSAIKNKRQTMLSHRIVFIHDNARPRVTKQLLADFPWEQFSRPSYGLDLVPSDFYLLLHMKSMMDGQNSNEDDEVKKPLTHTVTITGGIFLPRKNTKTSTSICKVLK